MHAVPEPIKAALHQTKRGAVCVADEGHVRLFIKLPHEQVPSLVWPTPITHSLMMESLPTAPVVCWHIYWRDDPRDSPNADIYFNVLDEGHGQILEYLSQQQYCPVHLIDGQDFSIVATAGIECPPNTTEILQEALSYANSVPVDQYDFDVALKVFHENYLVARLRIREIPLHPPCAEYYERFGPGKRFLRTNFVAHVKGCTPCHLVFTEIGRDEYKDGCTIIGPGYTDDGEGPKRRHSETGTPEKL